MARNETHGSLKNIDNDCKTCKFMEMSHGGGHCYMFRMEPEEQCLQHQVESRLVRAEYRRRNAPITGDVNK